jgi:hypothetical protein
MENEMKFKALVVDRRALESLDAALIEEEWFDEFMMPANSEGLRRVVLSDVVYILSNNADTDSGLLVVNIGRDGVFSGPGRKRPRFERILRVALRHFDRNVSLPVQWQAYHEGSRISVYAESVSRQVQTRIYFDQAAGERNDLYAYGTTDGPRPLLQVDPDMALFEAAVACLEDAIYAEEPQVSSVGNFSILLSERLGTQLGGSATLKQWLESRLNREQLSFVRKPHDAPVRLRGAAGTGKTQAMAIKCLEDMYEDADGPNSKTFAFLTHSSALAHEVVRGMLYALDPSERWQSLKSADGRPKLWMGTLYELAEEQLNYGHKGLSPLSLDGREGREYQRILIEDALAKVTTDARVMYSVLAEEAAFANRLTSARHRPALVEELMNEFACVLDAENVRKGTTQAEAYLAGVRERWQMPLTTCQQRQAVLEVHDVYRALLKQERLLSMDQMIADYDRYLSTHEWEQLRDRDGFDVIFVDEYHYFNRIEAMTLHSLFRSRAQRSGRWPLFMAYDLKQSTSDAALGGGFERFRNPGVGRSTEVELTENYRSTPQITAFLQDLDAAFPSMDLEGEYNTHIADSKQADGEQPVLHVYDSNTQLVDGVFEKAAEAARRIGGRRVAVLCLNDDLFDRYRKAGRIQGKFVPVTSREDLKELQFARTRCVFSMPQYVAGLQFEFVFLIHADQTDLSDDFLSQSARRRYVNRVYGGASRAQRRLMIAASKERGGKSEILNGPIDNRSLLEIG